MLQKLIMRRLDKEEKNLGQSLDYLRHMVRTSLGAFFAFSKIMPMARFHKTLPAEAGYVARIVAVRHEDCGACVQIEVNLARKARVPVEIIRAVLNSMPQNLSDELRAVYRFTESVVKADGAEDKWREMIRKAYGETGLIELALAIASSRVFPTTKRAMGFAKSCLLIKIEV